MGHPKSKQEIFEYLFSSMNCHSQTFKEDSRGYNHICIDVIDETIDNDTYYNILKILDGFEEHIYKNISMAICDTLTQLFDYKDNLDLNDIDQMFKLEDLLLGYGDEEDE